MADESSHSVLRRLCVLVGAGVVSGACGYFAVVDNWPEASVLVWFVLASVAVALIRRPLMATIAVFVIGSAAVRGSALAEHLHPSALDYEPMSRWPYDLVFDLMLSSCLWVFVFPVYLVFVGIGFDAPSDPERPVCNNCGYDLRGNVSGVCPECGRAR